MSKVGGALPAWYWPEGIPRRSPVPQQSIDRLVKRAASKGDAPALIWPDRRINYGELLDTVTGLAGAIAALAKDDDVVAILERDEGEALLLMLAAMQAGKQALMADLAAGAAAVAAQVEHGGASVGLTVGEAPTETPSGLRILNRTELDAAKDEKAKLRSVRATAPALMVPDGDHLAVHSNYSLAAMSVALTAFIPELKGMAVASPPPLWTWEGITFALCALLKGTPVFFAEFEELSGIEGFDADNSYTVIVRSKADEIADGKAPAVLKQMQYVFVSTPYFQSRWRKHLESHIGHEVLPIWGRAAFGPAVAAHPSWFPFDAHGIPLVNVRVLPVDPGSGEPSLVPWEMLDQAEIGVESPGQMTGFAEKEASDELLSGKIMRTHVPASVDHVGMVLMHKPPKSKAA
jgi:hypothetical protein